MVINNIIRDEACNSCDVHHNLAKVSNLLPLLSVDDSLNFLIQLCNELSNHEKHNICKSSFTVYIHLYNLQYMHLEICTTNMCLKEAGEIISSFLRSSY